MGTTTFTGPIKAGPIVNTSGTTLGSDVQNVGYVVMVQTAAIVQNLTDEYATPIVIPAGSHIMNIQMLNTVAWTGVATTMKFGTTQGGTELAALTNMPVGLVSISPGADAGRAANWDNVGPVDVRVWVTSPNGGDGIGTLTVRYLQGPH